uniref:Uncharacterized protein n=1 Tax=Oryza punctata TaxID=4537 RepID=A0A0E0L2J4_ORYPU
MEEDDGTVAVDDGGRQVVRTREEDDDISAVEAKGAASGLAVRHWATSSPASRCSLGPRATTGGCFSSVTLIKKSKFADLAPYSWPQRIGWSEPVMEMMDGCYCATLSSSLYHVATSFHDSIADYRSPPVNILLQGGYEIMGYEGDYEV